MRWLIKKSLRLISHFVGHRRLGLPQRKAPRISYWIAGGMGDGIMALPALVFLKKLFPHSIIDVFTPPDTTGHLALLLHPFQVYACTLKNVIVRTALDFGYDCSFTNSISAFRPSIEIFSRIASRYSAGFRYPDEKPNDRLYDFSFPIAETDHDIDQNLFLVADTTGTAVQESDRSYVRETSAVPVHKSTKVLLHPGREQVIRQRYGRMKISGN